ncbi:SNW domain-containing protein 1-like [Papio anubis]|uniref:SNW domain-containing protein 1-like n=1 Tax=Papio anubis TaxID=9555 RepID=UPI0012ADE732|nr:SNW domain-containing protein 1-like [Papio anubis]
MALPGEDTGDHSEEEERAPGGSGDCWQCRSEEETFRTAGHYAYQGMVSGFAGGEDEIYNVYDQAWRGGKDMAQSIYRSSKNLDKGMFGDDLEARIKTNRFVPHKFSGSDHRQRGREDEKDQFSLRKILLV